MGTDKALVDLAGARLVDRAVASLEVHTSDVLLATGSEPRYAELGRECVLDELSDAGPLAGLVAGLRAASERGSEALMISACDTPRASAVVFAALRDKLASSAADAVLLRTTEGIEPLIAIYRTTCLAPALAALSAGRRRMTSFHEAVQIDHVEEAELTVEAPATNVNTPEQLEAERLFFGEGLEERSA
jgi:molybdopterin-guanine dinucleotide biosynthesis protein A